MQVKIYQNIIHNQFKNTYISISRRYEPQHNIPELIFKLLITPSFLNDYMVNIEDNHGNIIRLSVSFKNSQKERKSIIKKIFRKLLKEFAISKIINNTYVELEPSELIITLNVFPPSSTDSIIFDIWDDILYKVIN